MASDLKTSVSQREENRISGEEGETDANGEERTVIVQRVEMAGEFDAQTLQSVISGALPGVDVGQVHLFNQMKGTRVDEVVDDLEEIPASAPGVENSAAGASAAAKKSGEGASVEVNRRITDMQKNMEDNTEGAVQARGAAALLEEAAAAPQENGDFSTVTSGAGDHSSTAGGGSTTAVVVDYAGGASSSSEPVLDSPPNRNWAYSPTEFLQLKQREETDDFLRSTEDADGPHLATDFQFCIRTGADVRTKQCKQLSHAQLVGVRGHALLAQASCPEQHKFIDNLDRLFAEKLRVP